MLVMMVPVPSHLFHWDRLVRQGQHLEVKCDILKFSCHVESVFMPDEHGSTSARQRSRKNPAMHFKIFKIRQSRSGATWNGVSRLACRMRRARFGNVHTRCGGPVNESQLSLESVHA